MFESEDPRPAEPRAPSFRMIVVDEEEASLRTTAARREYAKLVVYVVLIAGLALAVVVHTVTSRTEGSASAPAGEPPHVAAPTGSQVAGAYGAPMSAPAASDPIASGVRVVEAYPGTPGYDAGLRPGDVITAYDGDVVASDPSYKAARERHSRAGAGPAELTVLRSGKPLTLKMPAGLLGFEAEDCLGLMNKIYAQIALGQPAAAERLLADGLRDRSLGRAEELVARIWMIPDDASEADEARRDAMVEEFLSTCNFDDLGAYALNYFYTYGSYEAGSVVNRKALAEYPDDVSLRLNLGLCEARSGHIDEADHDVGLVLDRAEPGISPYGFGVAYSIRGYVEFGRDHYEAATRYFGDALDLRGLKGDWELENRYLYSAARVGLKAFRDARDHVGKVEPAGSPYMTCMAVLFEIYALDVADDREGAIRLAHANPSTLPPEAIRELNRFRQGPEVVERWSALVR